MTSDISTDDQNQIEFFFHKWLSGQDSPVDDVQPFFVGAKLKGNYLYVPVKISGKRSTWERVSLMQALEDAWNDQEKPKYRLVLVPVGANIELMN